MVDNATMKQRTPATRVRFVSCNVEIRDECCASDDGVTVALRVCSQGVAGTADVDDAEVGLDALMSAIFVAV